jgi:hypothetical protein
MSAVDDFGVKLVRVIVYAGRVLGRAPTATKTSSLFVYGDWKYAKIDVPMCHHTNGYLLAQEGKRYLALMGAPQHVTRAIAAIPTIEREISSAPSSSTSTSK